jgi:hypothetical protein
MIDREYKHQNRYRLCYCCDELQETEKDLFTLSILGRGYGSIFDSCSFMIQLCRKCYKPEYETWFNEKPVLDDYIERYKYEEKIEELISSFPIENQEYIWNGADGFWMDRQDWIDMQLGILPDEKYEEYGMYSPRQIKAYEERFTTCEHPVNVVYDDGSKACWCPFGASGGYGQKTEPNISIECFNCEYYKKREVPIKEMDWDTYKKYEKYINAKIDIEKYKDLFE